MNIGKKDVFWNYGGTAMRVFSGVIVLSFIIKLLPIEDVGLWGLFISLESIIYLFDFGFYTTISRNITYIFTGASKLKSEGVEQIEEGANINYPLLKGLLQTSRVVYAAVSIFMILTFSIFGTLYINKVLSAYNGDASMARIAWYLYGALLCYRFFTFYYDALLVGRGQIRRSRQIFVLSQTAHLITATTLLLLDFGIISLVIGQTLATIINRAIANRVFFDKKTREELRGVEAESWRKILKTLWPTLYKSGFSSVSGVLLKTILPLVGGLYLSLEQMGYYSISKFIVDLTFTLGLAWFMTYYPKLTSSASKGEGNEVKWIFLKSQIISLGIFVAAAFVTIFAGDEILAVLKRGNTLLLAAPLLLLYFTTSFIESITYMSTQVILSRNSVPYYKAQIITALASITTLVAALEFYSANVLWLILIPFASQMVYQHWRWFAKVVIELGITIKDYPTTLKKIFSL